MIIPFLDLKAQYRQIAAEVLPPIVEAMENGMFIGGSQVASFENEFAAFCESKYCIGVNSGTDALRFALMALGTGPGDEVITVPNTFIATSEAISQAGATPVFVDIDSKTCNIDVNLIEGAITAKTRAILPVHLYGQPADMDPILDLADRKNLLVIEDACQAHGATYKGRKAGSMGAAGCFSFYPGKNLGAFGDAGAVVTRNKAVAEKISMLRDHGQSRKYVHNMEGYNGRLDALQAAALRVKLKHLPAWNEARRRNAKLYDRLLSDIPGVEVVKEAEFTESVYHLYVIQIENREGMQAHLAEKGVATGLHYPIPLHLQKAYTARGYVKGSFPVTERIAERLLSIPMYPELTEAQIAYVVDCIAEFVKK